MAASSWCPRTPGPGRCAVEGGLPAAETQPARAPGSGAGSLSSVPGRSVPVTRQHSHF